MGLYSYSRAKKLEALAARHTEDGRINIDNAVPNDLLSSVNDPVVQLARRECVFAERLHFLP